MSNNEVRHRRVVTTDGLTLAVTAQGDPDRPTVVAVHGYPDDHTVWDGVVAELADRFHVVTYDVRGAGASDPPAERSGYLMEQLAADLAAVVDDVSPGRPVHLLAHDWGAIQTWHAVTGEQLRGRVASYTSISGPCLDHVGAWMRRPSAATLKQALSSWYIAFFQLPVVPELAWRSGLFGGFLARRERIPRPALRDGVNGIELYRANMRSHLGRPSERRTDVPVQVLAPEGDAYVSTPMQTEIGRFVDDLAIRTLPGGHWLPRSRPDVIARCVRELVEAVEHPEQPVAPALRTARTRAREDGRWSGRTVVVTGAGSGIGRETVLAFAKLGADVVAADRDLDTATETVRLAGSGCADRIWAHQVDVSDGAAMEEFAKQVAAEHGVPRLVVNNAGIGMAGPFADTTVADWQKIIDVNLWGVIHGCRLFAGQMRAHGEGGQIVNTASAAAFTPAKTLSAYSTTKAAVLMLSECLRAELAEHGIGVTAVCPGFVHTNLTRPGPPSSGLPSPSITATTRFVGADAETEKRHQDTVTALYQRRNYTPDRVATQIVAAAERNPALQPVTPEAHVSLAAYRLAPGLVRAIARRDIGPR